MLTLADTHVQAPVELLDTTLCCLGHYPSCRGHGGGEEGEREEGGKRGQWKEGGVMERREVEEVASSLHKHAMILILCYEA